MKIIHFLATMAISSLLGACNGGQYIVNRDPVDYVNPYHREYQSSARYHIPYHSIA